jgi:Ala-tRNA(Pro) deacylase
LIRVKVAHERCEGRQPAATELARKKPMGVAITVAQYLLDRDVAYELVPHPHTETALASAAASGLPADRVVKAVVLKGADGFMLALLPASRHVEFDDLRRVPGTGVDIAGESFDR